MSVKEDNQVELMESILDKCDLELLGLNEEEMEKFKNLPVKKEVKIWEKP